MKLLKLNETVISGNVASVDIRSGQYGPFGNLLLIADDGYFKKDPNNSNNQIWVEQEYAINVKLTSNVITAAGSASFQQGDYLAIKGKNIVEFGKDQQGNKDPKKAFPKVEAKIVLQHISAPVAKQLRADMKAVKQQNNSQSQNTVHQSQQNSGGFQQPQQNRPQSNSGGYNQNPQNNNGYNEPPRNHGERQAQQNGNPYNDNNNGYQQQQGRH